MCMSSFQMNRITTNPFDENIRINFPPFEEIFAEDSPKKPTTNPNDFSIVEENYLLLLAPPTMLFNNPPMTPIIPISPPKSPIKEATTPFPCSPLASNVSDVPLTPFLTPAAVPASVSTRRKKRKFSELSYELNDSMFSDDYQ